MMTMMINGEGRFRAPFLPLFDEQPFLTILKVRPSTNAGVILYE